MRSGSPRPCWRFRVAAWGALRRFGGGICLPLACGIAACEDEHTIEDTVDAKPGIDQVGSADGPLLDEADACGSLRDALLEARSDNGCEDEVVVPECPELIRPGGSLACVRYSEESIDECVARAQTYDGCGDFVSDACIVVAVVSEMSEGCVPPGPVDDDAGSEVDAGDDDDPVDDDVPDDDAADDDVDTTDAGPDGPEPSGDVDAGDEPDSGAEGAADASIPMVDSGSSDSGAEETDAGTSGDDVADSGTGASDAAP